MLAPRLTEVTSAEVRTVRRAAGRLAEAPDLETLGREFVREAAAVVPADLMLWNIWNPELTAVQQFQASHRHYIRELERRLPALEATVQYHPVVAAGCFEKTRLAPQRLSDYESDASFRANPLFCEYYRHVDSRHQIAYTPARLRDGQVLLNWNRRQRDFSTREMQLLHLLGLQLETLCRALEERRHLQQAWQALTAGLAQVSGHAGAWAAKLPDLRAKDARIVVGLIRGESRAELARSLHWRRDTLDRYLSRLRERLGVESMAELLQSFAALQHEPGRDGQPPVGGASA